MLLWVKPCQVVRLLVSVQNYQVKLPMSVTVTVISSVFVIKFLMRDATRSDYQ